MPRRRQSECCELCERDFLPLTFHHLVPRKVHNRRWVKLRWTRDELNQGLDLCQDCHGAVHRFLPDHEELARIGHSRELLLAHEEIGRFVAWVAQQRGRNPVRR